VYFFCDPYDNTNKTKRAAEKSAALFVVGVARLERATACTPCKNASQLHHTPIAFNCVESFDLRLQRYECFLNCCPLSEKKVTFAENIS